MTATTVLAANSNIDRRSVPLLAVDDLSIEFRTRSGIVRALDKVGFALKRGEAMALVGESGSGKSVTAYAIMGILDDAIKEHLELKRLHGAGDDELKKLEDEAFGAAERPGDEPPAPDPLAEDRKRVV